MKRGFRLVGIEEIVARALRNRDTMELDNSFPLMTHDITEAPCTGLADCPIHHSVKIEKEDV